MKILLEGIDGAGKSSLLKLLSPTPFEFGKPPKDVTPDAWEQQFADGYRVHDVIGRSHFSELVYGKMIRGKSLIDWTADIRLCNILREEQFQVFYVFSGYTATRERIMARENPSDYDLWVLDHYFEMDQLYRAVLHGVRYATVSNHGNASLEGLAAQIRGVV